MTINLPHHSIDESMDAIPSSSAPLTSYSPSCSSSPPASLGGSPSAMASVTDGNTQFFILLLCPNKLYFELVTITGNDDALPNDPIIYDMLRLIPQKCTEKRLLKNRYVGFVRTSDQVIFTDLDARAFRQVPDEEEGGQPDPIQQLRQEGFLRDNSWTSAQDYIQENDVLVAILDGYSARGMSELYKPILRNSSFADMICKRKSSKGSEGDIVEDASPPQGLFQALDVMAVERGSSSLLEHAPTHSEYVNSYDVNDRWITLEDEKFERLGGGDATARGGFFEPFTAVLDNTIDFFPMFSSKGNFTNHEPRGTMDQDTQGLTPSSVSSAPSGLSGSSGDDAPHRNRRNRRYVLMFSLLISFVVMASAIFLGRGSKHDINLIMQEPVSYEFGGDETASTATPSDTQNTPKPTNSPVTSYTPALTDATPSTQQPTEQPTHTESPSHTNQHTHPSMHHSPRHTDSPTHKHHHTHDVEHRLTNKPTGRPTHRRHTHSSTPTESPTRLKQHTHPLTQHPPRHTESPTTPPSTERSPSLLMVGERRLLSSICWEMVTSCASLEATSLMSVLPTLCWISTSWASLEATTLMSVSPMLWLISISWASAEAVSVTLEAPLL